MSSDDDPTVTVKYSSYQKLRDDQRSLQEKVYELEKKLAAAQLNDASGATKILFDVFHETIKIVQFAVGNLAPETVAGWPHQALYAIADAIEQVPGVDQHVKELPNDLRHFAKLAAGYEAYRKERDKNRIVTIATAADFGPKTPEAAAAHASKHGEAPGEPTVGTDVVPPT